MNTLWKLVPVETTSEMDKAAKAAAWEYDIELDIHQIDRIWNAMLKALPCDSSIAGYELSLDGKQREVVGEHGFPAGQLDVYLNNGYVAKTLWRKDNE